MPSWSSLHFIPNDNYSSPSCFRSQSAQSESDNARLLQGSFEEAEVLRAICYKFERSFFVVFLPNISLNHQLLSWLRR